MLTDILHVITQLLLPSQTDLRLDRVVIDDHTHTLVLEVTSTQDAPRCPSCARAATRVHSHYTRTLADLPWAEVAVRVEIAVRKCFCPSAACPHTIFCERMPSIACPWARRTARLAAHQQRIGVALGGAAGERLADDLDLPASRDTLIRLVRATPLANPPTPRILGVDDWAWHKGQTYGTILVDIERGVIIDLLPDRSAESFARWLTEHPGVEVISRDRGGIYADGARTGASSAVQVADRWHLLSNLGDALGKLLDQHRAAIEAQLGPTRAATPGSDVSDAPKEAPAAETNQTPTPTPAVVSTPIAATTESRQGDTKAVATTMLPADPQADQDKRPTGQRAQRQARYVEVCRLHALGWSIRAIADHVGLHRATVRSYLGAPGFPEFQPRTLQPSQLDPFKPYILDRWNAGCHTGTVILHEVEARGYQGCASTVLTYITQIRTAAGVPAKRRVGLTAAPITDPRQRVPSSRTLSGLVLRRFEVLDAEEEILLKRLTVINAAVTAGIILVQEFATMVRERQPERLDGWLLRAEQSGLAPLVSLANGLRKDYAAVKAGLTLEWSNGPTEGHVNRLKQVKRQMYGRAKLDLLKLRLMA